MKKRIKSKLQAKVLDSSFVMEVRNLIALARNAVVKNIDYIQVYTCFEIGRKIIEQEQEGEKRAEYGKELIKELANKLIIEFGNGFSERNLAYMRQFFLNYKDRKRAILQTVSAKSEEGQMAPAKLGKTEVLSQKFSLSWSHYIFLLGIDNEQERNFYEIEATEQNWSLRELKRQFNSSLYERLSLSRDKKGINP